MARRLSYIDLLGLSFNGATAVRPWMVESARAGDCAFRSFNGATAVRPWMDLKRHRNAARRTRLQWGHGREAMDGMLGWPPHAPLRKLQWGHGREAMDGPFATPSRQRRPSFNGATAVRPWMGHSPDDRTRLRAASMGPRP